MEFLEKKKPTKRGEGKDRLYTARDILLADLMFKDLDATSRMLEMNFELMTLQLKISKRHALGHHLIQGHIGGDEIVSSFDKKPVFVDEMLRAALWSWQKGSIEHQKTRGLYPEDVQQQV
ncbi:hypothetical protein VNO77_19324 [Canavalia gladiata]|uniref:Uncharacterized protein n=1 Tax=Canavalia gladiata TaxID=3824 RepID=A0AAN9LMG1_CANGL